MDIEACRQDQLRAIVPAWWNAWTVNKTGTPVYLEQLDVAESADRSEVGEYVCINCGQCFVNDGTSEKSAGLAWNQAIKHLAETASAA